MLPTVLSESMQLANEYSKYKAYFHISITNSRVMLVDSWSYKFQPLNNLTVIYEKPNSSSNYDDKCNI